MRIFEATYYPYGRDYDEGEPTRVIIGAMSELEARWTAEDYLWGNMVETTYNRKSELKSNIDMRELTIREGVL